MSLVGDDGPPTRPPFWAERDRRRALGHDARAGRQARRIAWAGFVLAAALPAVAFAPLVADIASQWRLDLHYLVAEWSPWVLMGAGLIASAPVVWSIGRDPESRLYPRARNAYAGWGVTLYLLGLALGVQVAQIGTTVAP